MDDLLKEFLAETSESMIALDQQLVSLENNPKDSELLNSIFRLMHTIKSSSSFLGLNRFKRIAHAAENILASIRDEKAVLSADIAALLMLSLSRIQLLLTELQEKGVEPLGQDDDIITALETMVLPPGIHPQKSAFAHKMDNDDDALLPIGSLWQRMQAVARDASFEANKKIHFKTHGEAVEVPRKVIRLMRDPLMHLIRNAIAHGIEKDTDRAHAGKLSEGSIVLDAQCRDGRLIIQVADDGAGISINKIKNEILKKSLATQQVLDGLEDQEVIAYIFKPGFSTADDVSTLSGRGVGMDVVKTNIEKIGGTIECESIPGKGTCFFIRIPLMMASQPPVRQVGL
ncbi:MAG: ATP-binding protein [Alphaproteobacteria bacterium]